jgi:hypothetical protein
MKWRREAPTIKALPKAPALTYAHVPGSIPNQLHIVATVVSYKILIDL